MQAPEEKPQEKPQPKRRKPSKSKSPLMPAKTSGERYTPEAFVTAIAGSGGIVSTICKRIGCNWWTAYRYIYKYPEVLQAYKDECEKVNDLAESVIIKSIKAGNIEDAKWWISRKRKLQFSTRSEVVVSFSPEELDAMSDEELERIAAGEAIAVDNWPVGKDTPE